MNLRIDITQCETYDSPVSPLKKSYSLTQSVLTLASVRKLQKCKS